MDDQSRDISTSVENAASATVEMPAEGAASKPKRQTKGKAKRVKTEDRPLSWKQMAFINAYIGVSAGNATDACRRAGYSGKDTALAVRGSELLRKRNIQEAIATKQAQNGISIEQWREMIISRYTHCTQPLRRSDGKVGQRAVDEPCAKGYAELLGRHIGAFEADNRQQGGQQVAIVLH